MIRNPTNEELLIFEENNIEKLYCCVNYCHISLEYMNNCPRCGRDVFIAPATSVGNMIFYLRGRNLCIQDRNNQNRNITIECADIIDLKEFITTIFLSSPE